MKKDRREKALKAVSIFIVMLLLAGCGNRLKVANMTEYTSTDGTYSIEADAGYNITDMGMDNWMVLEPSDGVDSLLVMQFPKQGGFLGGWSDVGDVIEFVEESNGLTDKEEIAKPESGQLRSVEAYSYKMTQDGYTGEIYTVYGETDYAHYFLGYTEGKVKVHSGDYFGKVCASFKENEEAIGEKSASAAEVSDTLRWFNASNAMLIKVNSWDYQIYGGLEPGRANQEIVKQVLDNSWGVTDKDSADETLDWLLTEGHRMGFAEEMELLEELGMDDVEEDERESFLIENFGLDEELAGYYARWFGRYEENYEDAASGWDYNRALSQLANFYLAGYYTLEEALDASLDVAERIQESFDSWDDYMESYFTGYEYWAEESSEERREVYRELQSAGNNPYSVDFKTKLEKSW